MGKERDGMGEYAWRKQDRLLRTLLEKNPTEEKPIGRPRIRWKDVMKNEVEELG